MIGKQIAAPSTSTVESSVPLDRKIVLLAASTLTVMAGATIAPSLPAMEANFSSVANADSLTRLVLTIPSLFIVLFAPFIGMLADRIGRKPIIIASVAIFVLAGTAAYFLNSLGSLLISRCFVGIGAAGVTTSTTVLIADYFDEEGRSRFLGLQAAAMGIGGVVFQLLGGQLAEFSWRTPFLLFLLPVFLITATIFHLVEPKPVQEEEEAPDEAPPSTWRPSLLTLYGLTFIGSAAFFIVPTQLPFHLQAINVVEPSLIGVALAVMTASGVVASFLYSKVRGRVAPSLMIALAFGGMAIGYGLVSQLLTFQGVLIGMVVSGIGKGLLIPHFSFLVIELVPKRLRGKLIGGLMASFFLGQFLSPLLTQPVGRNFGWPLVFAGAACILGAVCLYHVLRPTRSRLSSAPA